MAERAGEDHARRQRDRAEHDERTAVDRSVTVRWTISATAPIRPTIPIPETARSATKSPTKSTPTETVRASHNERSDGACRSTSTSTNSAPPMIATEPRTIAVRFGRSDIERARRERDEPDDDRDDRRPTELWDAHPEEGSLRIHRRSGPNVHRNHDGQQLQAARREDPKRERQASPRPAPSRPRAISHGARSHRVPARTRQRPCSPRRQRRRTTGRSASARCASWCPPTIHAPAAINATTLATSAVTCSVVLADRPTAMERPASAAAAPAYPRTPMRLVRTSVRSSTRRRPRARGRRVPGRSRRACASTSSDSSIVERAHRAEQLLLGARADDRRGHGRLVQQPRERDVGGPLPELLAERLPLRPAVGRFDSISPPCSPASAGPR